MRAAADQHEERKVPFLGAFWANLAFRADVSRGYANFLLHLAERLTWRQLVLLARAGRSTDEQAASLTEELDRRLNRDRPRDAGLPVELDELADLRLVEPPARRRTYGELEGGDMRMSFGDPGAGEPELTAMGRLLYELLELSEVPQEEILDSM
jgi:hypothetical protein